LKNLETSLGEKFDFSTINNQVVNVFGKVGGKYNVIVQVAGQSTPVDKKGKWKEVVKNKSISFLLTDDTTSKTYQEQKVPIALFGDSFPSKIKFNRISKICSKMTLTITTTLALAGGNKKCSASFDYMFVDPAVECVS
jgi:hypothetical protein